MGINTFVDKVNQMIEEEIKMEDYGVTYKGCHIPSSIDMDEQVKKYAANDAIAISEKVRTEIDARHLETLYVRTKVFSDEEQYAVANAIKPKILFDVLEGEFSRLINFENAVRNITS